jgi:hypothetical protein
LGLEIVPQLPVPFIVWPQNFQLDTIGMHSQLGGSDIEGYVVRNPESFDLHYFRNNIAKWVRADHVTTTKHWRQQWSENTLVSRDLVC